MKANLEFIDLDGREARRTADVLGRGARIEQGSTVGRFDVRGPVDTFKLVEVSIALRNLAEVNAVFA